jgi:tetratricopeptide (TPR) repeat protein
MSGFTVQIIVFSFSGIILITGIYLVIRGDTKKTNISAVFTVGFLSLIVAAINPNEILELKASGKGIHITRHQPGKEERKSVLKLATDTVTTISPEEKEKLVVDAERRPDQKRSPEDYLVLATEAWRGKEYDNALKFAFTGLSLKPDDTRVKATLIYRIGTAYNDLKIPDLAIKYYKDAMGEDPIFTWPHNGLGNLYSSQNRYAEAEEEYKKAIELDPEYATPHNGLGNLYSDQNRYAEAEEEFKKAIEINPEDATVHNNLGVFYIKQERYAEAEEEFKKAIEINPEDATVHHNLGNLYYDRKRYAEAEEEYKKAIELDPEYAKSHNSLGNLYYDRKKYAEAEEEYKKAIELDNNFEIAKENLKNLQAFIETN